MKPAYPTDSAQNNQLAGMNTEFLSRRSTKVLIQESATRRYLSNAGLWTGELTQAMSFPSGSAAMTYLTQKKLANVRLVLSRDINVQEVIPVTDLIRA